MSFLLQQQLRRSRIGIRTKPFQYPVHVSARCASITLWQFLVRSHCHLSANAHATCCTPLYVLATSESKGSKGSLQRMHTPALTVHSSLCTRRPILNRSFIQLRNHKHTKPRRLSHLHLTAKLKPDEAADNIRKLSATVGSHILLELSNAIVDWHYASSQRQAQNRLGLHLYPKT